MPKDRYNFDKKTDKSFDDYLLDSHMPDEVKERRAARLAKAEKKLAKRAAQDQKKQSLEERAKARGKMHVGRMFLYVCIFALFIGLAGAKFVKLGKLQKEQQETQAQLEALQEDEAQKEEELKEVNSDEYIEDAARSELHMIKVGETMYVVDSGEESDGESSQSDGAKPE